MNSQTPRTRSVMKFGGSSLASPTLRRRVVELAAAEHRLGPVALVLSALGGTTDHLLAALRAAAAGEPVDSHLFAVHALVAAEDVPATARAALATLLGELRGLLQGVRLLGEASPAATDAVVSFGERLSIEVIAAQLEARGHTALRLDSRTWCRTDDRHGDARVDEAHSYGTLAEMSATWPAEAIVVCTGYLGRTATGRTTTLGRNGSDYTATLLGRGLGAREVQIWSDVPGVMTANPRLVHEARLLERLSYEEALELAMFGAKVLHPRTLVPLLGSGVPLRIRDTNHPDHPGTFVDAHGADDEERATSVTSLVDQALLDIQLAVTSEGVQLGERVHRVLETHSTSVRLATHSAHGQAISVVVPCEDLPAIQAALEEALVYELGRGTVRPIEVKQPVSLLTLVGEAMGRTPNVAGRMFSALGEVGINVLAIGQSASARSISCAVDQALLRLAVRTVHDAMHLDQRRASLFLLGHGVVGSQLTAQLESQAPVLAAEHQLQLDLVGLATRTRHVFDPAGIVATKAVARLEPGGLDAGHLQTLSRLPNPVLIDCTAADGMELLYREALALGIHVVAANKKPLTVPQAERDALLAAARKAHRVYRYETTVGAALPVVTTLHDLLRTGDVVHAIEGSLSGTLGYLCSEVMAGVAIGDAVRQARQRGYTEPQPQEDLAGVDVARKSLILARELGLQLDLADVVVTPFVPAELLAETDLDAFFAALDAYAPTLQQQVRELEARGERLRYLATLRIDDAGAQLTVGPTAVGPRHPAYSLQGSQAFVAFTTRRYPTTPLVVLGAGAGGEVTASGVLADVLRVVGL